MDITVEILATSVPVKKEHLRYKVKTWWTHVDVGESQSPSIIIPLPSLPMLQPFYDMNGKETTVFVEMWYNNPELFPVGAMRFLGLAKQRVDNQLRNPAWNPTVEWLEVYDPIEDISRGRLLLKIDAHFQPSSVAVKSPLVSRTPRQPHPPPSSSYFNNSFPESVVSVVTVSTQNEGDAVKDTPAKKDSTPEITFHTTVSPIPRNKSVVEDERFEIPRRLNNPNPVLNSISDRDGKLNLKVKDKDKIDLDLEIAKAKLDLAVKERERNLKLLEQKGQPFTAQVSDRPFNSLPDFWNLDMSPIASTTTPAKRCRYKHYTKSSSNNAPSPPNAEYQTATDDSEVDEVINMLNRNIRIEPSNKEPALRREKIQLKTLHSKPPSSPELDTGTKNLIKNVEQLQQLQTEIKNFRPKQRYFSQGTGETVSNDIARLNAMAKVLDEEDLTIYGCGFHEVRPSSKNPNNKKKGPTTSLNYALVQEQRTNTSTPPKSSYFQNTDNYTKSSMPSPSPTAIPPLSRKCAAKFDQK